MSLVTLKDILPEARRQGYAVAAFNVANLETLYPVVRAAELEGYPLIVQVYQRLFNDERAGMIAAMCRRLAETRRIPIALHLDHGASLDVIIKAIACGYTSVMFDGSALEPAENIRMTRQAVEIARSAGVSIEAEIGHVPFGDGEIRLSEPSEAEEFIAATGVDALAISVGTVHGYYKQAPKLDIERTRAISKAVDTPLVLHGGTGVPDAELCAAVGNGVAKVNIATEMQHLFLR